MTQLFTAAHLRTLRTEYARIETVDPCGPSYAKMVELVDGMELATLRQVAAAKIRFLSNLAANRVTRREQSERLARRVASLRRQRGC